jgi:hypothetical protein
MQIILLLQVVCLTTMGFVDQYFMDGVIARSSIFGRHGHYKKMMILAVKEML